MNGMQIGVVGGGAIGLLTAFYLQGQGHAVTLYVRRTDQMRGLLDQGLRVLPHNHRVFVQVNLIEDVCEQDIIFICTKQPSLPIVIEVLEQKSIRNPIVFLQNGMGHIDFIQNLSAPVAVGVMEHGAIKNHDTLVRHTGRGKLNIAPLTMNQEEVEQWRQALSTKWFPIYIEKDWFNMLALKLIVNAVINPITALFQVRNGEIIENPYLMNLAKQLCGEVSQVLHLSYEHQWERIAQIAYSTRQNISSMAKDIEEQRQTEVEAILGYLLTQATSYKPIIQMMYESIKAKEYSFSKEGEK